MDAPDERGHPASMRRLLDSRSFFHAGVALVQSGDGFPCAVFQVVDSSALVEAGHALVLFAVRALHDRFPGADDRGDIDWLIEKERFLERVNLRVERLADRVPDRKRT